MARLRPTIVSAATTASVDKALAVLTPRATSTFGELAHAALVELSGYAVILCDKVAQKLYVSNDSDTYQQWLDYLSNFMEGAKLIVSPAMNSLLSHYNIVQDSFGTDDVAAFFNATNRRSLASVINHFPNCFIIVNQNDGTVLFYSADASPPDSDYIAAISASGDTICFQLAEKPPTEHLPFE